MVRGDLHSLDRLLEGPVFADEVSGGSIDEELREMLGVNHFRIVPPRSGMAGVYGIYFLDKHTAEAIVRYAQRYRWIFEILSRTGLRGRYTLKKAGFPEDGIEFLYSIIPNIDNGVNPIVYQILWSATDHKEYLDVASELKDESRFVPQEIINRSRDLSKEDRGYFSKFVRHHLIESIEAVETRQRHRGGEGGDTVAIDLDKEYRMTKTGKEAIPAIISEYQRIFIEKEFEPLRIGEDEFESQQSTNGGQESEPYQNAQVATEPDDDVISVDDTEQSDLADFIGEG